MHSSNIIITLSAAAAQVAWAQSSIVTSAVLAFGSDSDIYGSVVGVGSGLTTVALNCAKAPSTKSDDDFDPCAGNFKATLFLGTSTVSSEHTFTEEHPERGVAVTTEMKVGCVLGTKDATCTGTMTAHGSLVAGTITSSASSVTVLSEVVEDWATEASPLTITGGLEKLSGNAKTTGTDAGAASTSTSKAGAPMVTARAVLAGVAAVVAAL